MEHTQTYDGSTAPGKDSPTGAESSRLVGSDRVLAVIEEPARYPGGVGLEELTRAIGSPNPTVHRGLGALRRAGLADQDTRGRSVLGDKFLRMAFAHPAHTTAVGKLLLMRQLSSLEEVEARIGGSPPERRTPRSRCTAADQHREPAATRARGYGVGDQENENGVNCLALPVYPTSPTIPSGAVSVRAPAYRTPLATLIDALAEIRTILGPLGEPHR